MRWMPGSWPGAGAVATAATLLAALAVTAACSARAQPGVHAVAGAQGAQSGSWGKPRDVPSSAVPVLAPGQKRERGTGNEGGWTSSLTSEGLDTHRTAYVNMLSCPSAGNCTTGGSYKDAQGRPSLFLASQRDGRWQPATEIPGMATRYDGGAQVTSLSCPSPGNCTAGGWYLDSSYNRHAFVISERGGHWQAPIEVPGTQSQPHSWVNAVSCWSPGNCAAGGGYVGKDQQGWGWVATEENWQWYTDVELYDVPNPPFTADSNVPEAAEVTGVSCSSDGHCVAGGSYVNYSAQNQSFLVSYS